MDIPTIKLNKPITYILLFQSKDIRYIAIAPNINVTEVISEDAVPASFLETCSIIVLLTGALVKVKKNVIIIITKSILSGVSGIVINIINPPIEPPIYPTVAICLDLIYLINLVKINDAIIIAKALHPK